MDERPFDYRVTEGTSKLKLVSYRSPLRFDVIPSPLGQLGVAPEGKLLDM